MPGKASVPLSRYMSAFEAAVGVFGRGQVSTYILAGLGDTREAILDMCAQLLALGVYPFVVPFVPISGTPLEGHPAPSSEFMKSILAAAGPDGVGRQPALGRHQGRLWQVRRLFVALDLRNLKPHGGPTHADD